MKPNTRCSRARWLYVFFLLILAYPALAQQQRRYVDASAPPGGDGLTWETAFRMLQDALAVLEVDDIWVAEGTYYPDLYEQNPLEEGKRCTAFNMRSGVTMLGGFQGTEDEEHQRNPAAHPTILSGDIDGDGLLDAQNSLHVVVAGDTVLQLAVLDGFFIEAGFADGGVGTCSYPAGPEESKGAGIYMDRARLNIRDCTIRDNKCNTLGGGMYFIGPVVAIVKCRFFDNSASPEVSLTHGGGLHAESSSESPLLRLYNCHFAGNQAADGGGGLYFGNIVSPPSDDELPFRWEIVNSLFVDNEAGDDAGADGNGGAMLFSRGDGDVVNCTIADNGRGGGTFIAPAVTELRLMNLILWGNRDEGVPKQIGGDSVSINYSIIEGGMQSGWSGGVQVLDEDPLFIANSYRVALNSPARNGGHTPTIGLFPDIFDVDDDDDELEPTPDLDLNHRVQECIVDMGAYEFTPGCPEDVNADGSIDIEDIMAIIDDWGPCPAPPDPCPADADGDGTVGTGDLDAVLAAWGPCGCPDPAGPPQSVEDCIEKFGSDPQKLAACLEALLLTGGP